MSNLRLRPWISQLSIKTTKLDIRPFDLDYIDPDPTIGDWGWAQRPFVAEVERQYNLDLPVRIIVLKARQLGISTACEAIAFLWAFLHPGSNNIVVSHEDGQAQELFQMTRLFWETWPHRALFHLKYGTRRQMLWEETRSQIRVATAKNAEGLRGSTITAIHASEVAFWPEPETLWTGLSSTLHDRHHTLAVLESTANGVGNWFHEQWLAAEEGDSDFQPMFFPWYRHSSYRARNHLHRVEMDAEEKQLLRKMQDEGYTADESMAACAWRRLEIRKKGAIENFMQEYPSCVTGETRVGTSRGLVRIDTISSGEHSTMGRVIKSHEQPASPISVLSTKDGYWLRGTWDHPIFLQSGVLQPLSTLKPGQKIKLQPPRLAETYHTVTWRDTGVDHSLTITEEWGRLLGFFMGDGNLYGDSLCFACDGKDQDVVDDVIKLLDVTMGLQGKARRTGTKKGCSEVRVSSKKIKPLFDRLDLLRRQEANGHIMRKVHVPEIIWRSPPSVVKEFLRGLFEADGFNGYNSPRVLIFSKHMQFLADLQILLLAMEVTSRRTSRKAKNGQGYEYDANELVLSGDRAAAFLEKIGFVSDRKNHVWGDKNPKWGRKRTPNNFVTEVSEVVSDGFEPTYDLTVEDGEAFDANGILTHNTPHEAFVVSGHPIFNAGDIEDCFEEQKGLKGEFYRNGRGEVEFLQNPSGRWTLFKKPCPEPRSDMYMVGGDPSRTVYGDPGCIQVLNRMWGEQVAVWNGHKIPHEFAQEMIMVGDFYHHAMLCPEIEGGGQGVISTILASGYGNVWLQKWADRTKTSQSMYGWSTSYQRKRWAIGILQKYLAGGDLLLHDKRTVHELQYFTENEDGVLGNSGNAKHDDTVMALAITVIASYTEGAVLPSSPYPARTPDIYTTEFEDNIVDFMARVRK